MNNTVGMNTGCWMTKDRKLHSVMGDRNQLTGNIQVGSERTV